MDDGDRPQGDACADRAVGYSVPASDLAARLQTAIRAPGDSVVAAREGRRHLVVGLWPVGCYDTLEAAVRQEGLRKVEAWTDRVNARVVSFDDATADPFFNVNTPSDLTAARDLLGINP